MEWRKTTRKIRAGAEFFALPAFQKIKGVIPIYQDRVQGKYKLSTSVKNQSKGTPLFYALPIEPIKDQEISGTWKCEADDFPLMMDVKMDGDKLNLSFDDKNLRATDVTFANDTIVIKVEDDSEDAEYIITSSILKGSMDGIIVKPGTEENFRWKGERLDKLRKLAESKAVVPLYEYQRDDGAYYYSTDPSLSNMKRLERPLCKVWRNPTSILKLDYTAKPIVEKE